MHDHRVFIRIAATTLGLFVIACGDIRLLATPTPTTPPPIVRTAAPTAQFPIFGDPVCGEYDDYQASAMAFYSLSAIVQDGLDSAPPDTEGESLDSAVARFVATVRRALAGESVVPADPIEELAMLWVVSDGCMR